MKEVWSFVGCKVLDFVFAEFCGCLLKEVRSSIGGTLEGSVVEVDV